MYEWSLCGIMLRVVTVFQVNEAGARRAQELVNNKIPSHRIHEEFLVVLQ